MTDQNVRCPQCKGSIAVDDLNVPRRVRCNSCGYEWRIAPADSQSPSTQFADLSSSARAQMCDFLRQLHCIDDPDVADPEALVREFGLGEVDAGSGEQGTERQTVSWLGNCLVQLAEGIPANGWRIGRVEVKQLPSTRPFLMHVSIQAFGETNGRIVEAREFTMTAIKYGNDVYWQHNGTRHQEVQNTD